MFLEEFHKSFKIEVVGKQIVILKINQNNQ